MYRSWIAWLVGVVMWATAQHGMVMFHYPRWSPDGQWLVMTSNIDGGSDEEVWIVSADGVSKRRLTTNDVADTAADWLPDGRSIVFERQAATGVETLAMDADGTNVRVYVPDAARLKQLRLANGGRTVSERRSPDGQVIDVKDASGERRIGQRRWSEQPSLSPDGRYVVFEQRQDPHQILSSEHRALGFDNGDSQGPGAWHRSLVVAGWPDGSLQGAGRGDRGTPDYGHRCHLRHAARGRGGRPSTVLSGWPRGRLHDRRPTSNGCVRHSRGWFGEALPHVWVEVIR